ncbi:phage holin family protein [Planococcus plakortidis]|uniref:hypothetical protein n=1 Tax=Planococcus plakortidis TaxID=1038856 RepID=UPI00385DB7F6
MRKKILVRLQNPNVILGIVSGILMILVNLDIIDLDLSKQISNLVNAVLSIGVSIGIFANPESHMINAGNEDIEL